MLICQYQIYKYFKIHIFREVPKTEAEKAAEAKDQAKKEQTEAVKKGRSGLLGYFQSLTDKEKKKGNIEFSLGNLFSCLCFTSEDNACNDVKKEMMVMADKLDKIEKALTGNRNQGINDDTSSSDSDTDREEYEEKEKEELKKKISNVSLPKKIQFETPIRDGMINPYWMDESEDENTRKCKALVKAERLKMDPHEITFWEEMIEKYLKPLDENKDQKKKATLELKELKNSVSLGFVLINVMWVTAVYMLQV